MKSINISFLIVVLFAVACKSKPKVIVEDKPEVQNSTNKAAVASTNENATGGSPSDMHQVTAVEILQAERYTYMKVKENAETFWIATVKFEAKKGNKYFYRGGLLKTNFESQEHNRVFDKIFLVSSIIDAEAHPSGEETHTGTSEIAPNTAEMKQVSGAIKVNELITNREKYNGKSVVVSGKCVKANYGIMGKNWYHIQDGTKKAGKNSDITITSDENIPLGANVAFVGKVILNKDFGAGYKYEILLEEGKLK